MLLSPRERRRDAMADQLLSTTTASGPARQPAILLEVNAVVLAVTQETPLVLTLRVSAAGGKSAHSLPSGPFDPLRHRTLEEAVRATVTSETRLGLGYVEQLYTFADRYRDPQELSGGPRRVSIGYLALVRQARPTAIPGAEWVDVYEFLPWEDRRAGRNDVAERTIAPRLQEWIARESEPIVQRARRERLALTFPPAGGWDPSRALDRFELLYETGLAGEARRDAWQRAALAALTLGASGPSSTPAGESGGPGREMLQDHRRMLATGLSRLRGKLDYRPVIFELLPREFTLFRLQSVVEALAGVRLHKQNFRRLVITGGLVEPTGRRDQRTGGRPAALYRFRREVVRERPAPGVGLPLHRTD